MVTLRAFLSVFLLTVHSVAQVPSNVMPPLPEFRVELQDIPVGQDTIVLLEAGKPAPFSGQLFSNDTALRWGNWLEQYRVQTPLMLHAQERVCSAEIRFRDESMAVHERASKAIQEDLRSRLVKVEQRNAELLAEHLKGPPWHRSRTFGIVLGTVGTLGVTALSIWAVSAAAR
jgi:hypothetical protein